MTSQRKEHHISCSADSIGPILTFEQYAGCGRPNSTSTTTTTIEEDEPLFDQAILTYLEKNNFHKATLVQAQSIPVALCGKDLIVTSHTGR